MSVVTSVLNRDHLRAVACLMASSDIRYYLNGMHVELFPDCTFLVATDGHKLGVCRNETDTADPDGFERNIPDEGVTFIIPRDLVLGVKRDRMPLVRVRFDPATGLVTLEDGAGKASSAHAVEGKFPDWRRVLPTEPGKEAGQAGQFNSDYIAAFGKVAGILGSRGFTSPRIWHNGANSALIEIPGCEAFRGVLMPLRDDKGTFPPTREWRESAIADAARKAKYAAECAAAEAAAAARKAAKAQPEKEAERIAA